MSKKIIQITCAFLLLPFLLMTGSGQRLVCKPRALAALKKLPELKYQCNEDLTESDDEVLTQPNRRKALARYARTLETFDDPDWWNTSVDDLDLCYFRRKAGALTKDQKQEFEFSEANYNLRGNERFRVVVAKDPCYQVGFNGSDIFLLNRVGNKVFASEIIDGFYTRADFPLGFDYALNGTETIIEIATTSGGLDPYDTNYYFSIDRKTNRAVPRNLFKSDGKFTNRIISQMLFDSPEDYGLPPNSKSLQVIKNHRLAKSFNVFDDALIDPDDQQLKSRLIRFRWNGKYYSVK